MFVHMVVRAPASQLSATGCAVVQCGLPREAAWCGGK